MQLVPQRSLADDPQVGWLARSVAIAGVSACLIGGLERARSLDVAPIVAKAVSDFAARAPAELAVKAPPELAARAPTGLAVKAPPELATRAPSELAVPLGLTPRTTSELASDPPTEPAVNPPELGAEAGADAEGTPAATPPGPTPAVDAFFGADDAPALAALRSGHIARIDNGRGGRSIAFRITLSNGQKGYFKPEQTFSSSNWFGEIAAYHLDRMLGLGRVPAAVSRVFSYEELEPTAQADARKDEMIVRDGQVAGAFVAWVTGELVPMESREGWESWLRVEHWATTAVNPFQRAARWLEDLKQFRALGDGWRTPAERARLRELKPEPDRPDRPAELSDLIVFDYLTRNLDRWGGSNANVLVRGAQGPLVFMDNGAGFVANVARPTLSEARLRVLQRFRRSTIEAVRAFDVARFEARLAGEAVQPVLRRSQIAGLLARRKALLAHVSALEAQHGEQIWAWP